MFEFKNEDRLGAGTLIANRGGETRSINYVVVEIILDKADFVARQDVFWD